MSGSASATVALGRGRSTAALPASARRSAVHTLDAVRRTANGTLRRVASATASASTIQTVPK
jgi:hypothetical protein